MQHGTVRALQRINTSDTFRRCENSPTSLLFVPGMGKMFLRKNPGIWQFLFRRQLNDAIFTQRRSPNCNILWIPWLVLLVVCKQEAIMFHGLNLRRYKYTTERKTSAANPWLVLWVWSSVFIFRWSDLKHEIRFKMPPPCLLRLYSVRGEVPQLTNVQPHPRVKRVKV